MSDFIQVVSRDLQLGADALPTIFHMVWFKYVKLARDVDLLMDQSERLPNGIPVQNANLFHYSNLCVFCWWWVFAVFSYLFSFLKILPY